MKTFKAAFGVKMFKITKELINLLLSSIRTPDVHLGGLRPKLVNLLKGMKENNVKDVFEKWRRAERG